MTVEAASSEQRLRPASRRRTRQRPRIAGRQQRAYRTAEAAKYAAECSLYDGPTGTIV